MAQTVSVPVAPPPPFNDLAPTKLHSPSSFHPDDLWTACGAYVEDGILSSVCSEDELSSMVSMVTSSMPQESHHHHNHHHHNLHQIEVLPFGLHHRNASFDSGSPGSRDSGTPPLSASSPVTVLPPLAFSSSSSSSATAAAAVDDDGKGHDHESYANYVSGLWSTGHVVDQSSDCMLGSSGCGGGGDHEHFSSSMLVDEFPLRSYSNGGVVVDQVRGIGSSGNNDYQLDCIVPPVSAAPPSHVSCKNSDHNTTSSTPSSDSSHTAVESSLSSQQQQQQEFFLGQECGAVEQNGGRHSPNSRMTVEGALVHGGGGGGESEISPSAAAAAHRRLSWTDHYWPATTTTSSNTGVTHQTSLNSFHHHGHHYSTNATTTQQQQRILLPLQQIGNGGFNSSAAAIAPPMSSLPNVDYHPPVSYNSQFGKTQLQEIPSGGGVENPLKRPYSATQSACSDITTSSSAAAAAGATPATAAAASRSFLTFANKQQQDAAALSALLYKSNQGGNGLTSKQAAVAAMVGGSSTTAAIAADSSKASGGMTTTTTLAAESSKLMPPPKLRRRHGTATDPQSIAARTRRERFSDRIRVLQTLVPNGERLDTVSMLGHTLEYVKFLQHKVWQLYNGADDASLAGPDAETREKWKEFTDTQIPLSS